MMAKTENITASNAARQDFMPVMRELVRAYQAFESYDAANLQQFGLTAPQADVLFTLGNTTGMVFKDIGLHTLITKGTLTGIVDRLEQKNLVKRQACASDRRRMFVVLTPKGEQMFNDVFPKQVSYLKKRFDRLSNNEKQQAQQILKKIRSIF